MSNFVHLDQIARKKNVGGKRLEFGNRYTYLIKYEG